MSTMSFTSPTILCNRRVLMVALAGVGFGVGVAVYLIDRPSWQVFSMPEGLSMYRHGQRVFGPFSGQLPDFFHAFAFTSLSVAIFARNRREAVGLLVAWGLFDSLFEIFQHTALDDTLWAFVSSVLDSTTWAAGTLRYFSAGTFDLADILAIWIGVLVSLCMSMKLLDEGAEK